MPEPSPFPPPLPATLVADAEPVPPEQAAHLTPGWRWIIAITWATVITGLGTLVDLGDYLGKLPWWSGGVVLVVVGPLVVILAAARDWRTTIGLSFAGTGMLAALAIGDLLRERPGVAAVEGILALAALLVSIAALVAREPGQ